MIAVTPPRPGTPLRCPQNVLREGPVRAPPEKREAERRKARLLIVAAARSPTHRRAAAETPFDAPPWRFLFPGPFFRGQFRRDFPAFPAPVQPASSGRAPLVGPGQPPRTSRVRKATSAPRPQAPPPHPALPSVPGNAPQWDEVIRFTIHIGIIVNLRCEKYPSLGSISSAGYFCTPK